MINTWPGWECVKLLGEGSFGKVYEIRKTEFGTTYKAALKVITIPPAPGDVKAAYAEGMDEQSVTDYFRSVVEDIVEEFALMSQLKGTSNIVSYEDHMVTPHPGEIGWDILIRMELLTALPEYAAEHPLDEAEVVRLGIHMARALQLCRRKGILHRDMKPENIFVSENGDYKLGDFGVARIAEKTSAQMSRKGTYSYMAPEVYKGEEYGYSADLYSLGLVLYRYLNDNRLPFMPPYPQQIRYTDHEKALKARMSGEEIPAPAHGSPQLKAVIRKLCSYDRSARFTSPEELEQALRAVGKTEESAKPDSSAEPDPSAEPNPSVAPSPSDIAALDDEDEFDKTLSAFEPSKGKGASAEEKTGMKAEEAARAVGKEPLIVKILCGIIIAVLVFTSIMVLLIAPFPLSVFSVAIYAGLIVLIQKIRRKRWGSGKG